MHLVTKVILFLAIPWKLSNILNGFYFDSLRYHLLHPDYLYFRIRELQKNFKLRVVLCHVDVVSFLVNDQL